MTDGNKHENEPNPFKKRDDAVEMYETVTDVATGLSLRWRDTLIQGLSILAAVIIGAPIGWLIAGEAWGLLVGAFCGLVGGPLLSGTVLMVLGWVRTARKINKR
jgi:hypothetical protein